VLLTGEGEADEDSDDGTDHSALWDSEGTDYDSDEGKPWRYHKDVGYTE
jgi:hypothetical protein